jgi:hypothetical protein
MDHATSAGAGAAITSLLWLPTLNPWLQLVLTGMGIVWIAMQMYRYNKEDK